MAGRRLLAVFLAALPGSAWAEAACAPDRLDIRGAGGRESFAVEVADDPAERAQGLMFRESLPLSQGMLFVYETPGRPAFWMKNTLIALDMIFADRTGTVTRVHADAVPGDLTAIDGGPGVMFVLEINGGLAARLGIGPGATLRHPSIPADLAAWPCDG
ncbi:DUF192 domain-containing protein [Rhodobacter calidifons]|uniref:DUF192 domain-containing protein n=1 Tax=Rhodobacter calidifons TaxID=2715277 RepID=A0ABX0G797_9RHOB|nr:DUF192 domain-containing protein [Rhodobacter calidifons]NHB76724.1 DUF192 domain-containing protein [Rhodobacter calidifons]